MINENFGEFVEVWNVAQEMMANGKQLSNAAMKVSFRMLQPYSIENVTAAIYKHIETMKFAPQVSDIRDLLETGNKRLSAHEVLSEMPRTEKATVVWTPEAQEAWGKASDLKSQYSIDKCFVETYERLCKESELLNRPITWSVSLGEDVAARTPVLEAAYAKGRISQTTLQHCLPAPRNVTVEGQALITGKVEGKSFHPEFKKKLSEMWNLIDDADKEEQERLNAENLAVERSRRDKEDEAIALLLPEQQLALLSQSMAIFEIHDSLVAA